MTPDKLEQERKTFEETFGGQPELLVRSPGRVNIIGEHTDYNEGFVFPATINRQIRCWVRRTGGQTVRLHSLNYGEAVEFELNGLKRAKHWSDYVKGTLHELERRKLPLGGFEAVIGGDMPLGSGLSSSASFELAISEACAGMFGFELAPWDQIKLCRRAENQFVGVGCGIMDQFAIRMGRKNHGLFLDCRSLEYEAVPIPSDELLFVIAYTGVPRGLGATEYHQRQKQCQRGVRFFSSINESLRSLRDVTEDLLFINKDKLDPVIYKRCRHVLTENRRVLQAVEALKQPDMKLFGELMNQSHESCKNDYEVSSRELDLLVDLARMVPGVMGARMTGAGFGGCTINLVDKQQVEEFQSRVGSMYRRSTGLEPQFYVTRAEDSVTAERL